MVRLITRIVGGRCAPLWGDRWLSVAAVTALLWGIFPYLSHAQFPDAGVKRSARNEALQAIPWTKLTPAATARIREVLEGSSIVRRLPAETIQCDPDLYTFLVRHPEVVVNIWRHMGITRCSLKRVEPFVLEAADGAGTTSRVELIYGSSDLHVLIAEGEYRGRLTRQPIHGTCLLILRTEAEPAANGLAAETKITSQMDVFLTLDHKTAEVVAKALLPVVGGTVDQNFRHTVQFVGQIAQVAKRNRDGMQRLALQLDSLDRTVRDEFAILAARIGEVAAETGRNGASERRSN